MAAQGADPATILCVDSADMLDCAVILRPEGALAQSRLVVYVGMLGLGDAIGSVVPPGMDITYRWPARIDANLGFVARVRLSAPSNVAETAVPPWLVLRTSVAVSGTPSDRVDGDGFETTLVDEGAADLTTRELLEGFAKHFLTWASRWQDDGFPPIRAMWLRHSAEKGREMAVSVEREVFRGVFEDIDDDGALLLRKAGAVDRIALAASLDS
jgi:biotin-(acetyl-CoA carboxylase) ligase